MFELRHPSRHTIETIARVFTIAFIFSGITSAAEGAGADSKSGIPLGVSHCREAPKFGGVQIEFRNMRAVAADEVRFSVTLGAITRTIADRGTFSPDVRIDRVYGTFNDLFLRSFKTACTIQYVHFTDGTSWPA